MYSPSCASSTAALHATPDPLGDVWISMEALREVDVLEVNEKRQEAPLRHAPLRK